MRVPPRVQQVASRGTDFDVIDLDAELRGAQCDVSVYLQPIGSR